MKRDLVSFALWKREELEEILALARRFSSASDSRRSLEGRSVALVFEHASLRTRVSFEVGINELGGSPVFLQEQAIGIATRESVHDVAVTLSEYCRLIVARTAKHQTCLQFAESASVPVINALTDLLHPCQILADVFTLQELQRWSPSEKVVFIGNGNNIANSWLELAEKIPMHLVVCTPAGYEPHPGILEQAQHAKVSTIEVVQDPRSAVRDASVVYTDKWFHAHATVDDVRRQYAFRAFQVNGALLSGARPDCIVMHRLPANRGEEIAGDVLDGPRCVAMKQVHNRLAIQKAVMSYLIASTR